MKGILEQLCARLMILLKSQSILSLSLVLVAQVSRAQSNSYNFINLTNKDGLSSNSVNAIMKDKYGYVWFGTEDGLNKFDGENFTTYRQILNDTTSLRGNRIMALCEDKTGNLWIGTNESLSYYDRKKDAFTNYNLSDAGVIRSLCIDHWGNLWIGSFNGLFKKELRTGNLTHFQAGPSKSKQLASDIIVCLYEDSHNRLWVGTSEGLHLFQKEENAFKRFIHSPSDSLSISDNVIRTITEDRNKNLWIGTNDGGISQLLPNGFGFKNFRNNPKDANTLSSDRVYTIAPDYSGKLWVGTEEGVNVFDPQSHRVVRIINDPRNKYCLLDKSVRSIYIDDNKIFWIGTFQGGVGKYDTNLPFFNLRQSNPFDSYGLSGPKVTSFVEDAHGDIYVGTDGGGLNHYHRKTGLFCHPTLINGAANKSLTILAMERYKEELWIGTYGKGLYVLNLKTNGVKHYGKGEGSAALLSNDIFCLKKDHNGNIWIGTNGDGVNKFDRITGLFTRFEKNSKNLKSSFVLNGFIRAIEEDMAGNIWIGTNGTGISIYNPVSKTFKILDRSNSNIPSELVSSIHVSTAGPVWIGTFGGGLSKLSANNTFISYSEKDGLPNSVIYKVLESGQGKLWVSHNKGVSSFDTNTGKFKNYYSYNGLQPSTFSLGAGLKTSNGDLFFGGLDGFNFFDPQSLKCNESIPPVVFTDLKIANRSVVPGPDEPLEEHVSVAKEIRLAYRQSFSLEFIALNYTAPQDTRYTYKLQGFDKEWNHAGLSHKAVYTNLDPGHYTFLVKAVSDDGLLHGQASSIEIYVKPPLWKTGYAYVLYVLLAAAALLVWRYIAIRRIKKKFVLEQERRDIKQMIEQERKEAEKQHEFDQQKIKFLTNLSHEFRTPLSLIVAPLEKISLGEENPDRKKQINMVQRNAKRLLHLVNQLLDFRKLEENELNLLSTEGDLVAFIKDIGESFKDLSEQKRIDFSFSTSFENFYTYFDHDKIERVLFNFLSNAFKFTGSGGKINLQIEMGAESNPEIIISDTGLGIKLEDQSKIFEPFFQGTGQSRLLNQGSGIGLSIAKEFIKLHGGTIHLKSEPGKGTVFTISLPLQAIAKSISEEEKAQEIMAGTFVNPVLEKETGEMDKPNILIVEDNDDFRSCLKDSLAPHYKIVEAANGGDGWKKVLSTHPKVIVSDINMPGVDGITLSRKIKSDKRTSHIPVILLTALTGDSYQLKGLNTGASDYLTKPFNLEILNIKIKNLISLNDKLESTFKKQIKLTTSKPEIQSDKEKLLVNIAQFIEANIDNPQLTVEDLSKHVFISRGTLYNKILELTGQTPVEFIRSIRLNRAAVLLEEGDMKIGEVGYAVGFTMPNYFAKMFKSRFNVSPSEYMTIKRKGRTLEKQPDLSSPK